MTSVSVAATCRSSFRHSATSVPGWNGMLSQWTWPGSSVVFCVMSAEGSWLTGFGAWAGPTIWPFRRSCTEWQLLNALTRTLPVVLRFQVFASLTTGLIWFGVQSAW
ncbi:Uncharacterised protein [Burkholderia gladioli]|nr:Uncharacterised protein [Burkholderia gladioli]